MFHCKDRETRAAMLEVLQAAEWSNDGKCPYCGSEYKLDTGHATDCTLAAMAWELQGFPYPEGHVRADGLIGFRPGSFDEKRHAKFFNDKRYAAFVSCGRPRKNP